MKDTAQEPIYQAINYYRD